MGERFLRECSYLVTIAASFLLSIRSSMCLSMNKSSSISKPFTVTKSLHWKPKKLYLRTASKLQHLESPHNTAKFSR